MYCTSIETQFASSHQLHGYEGPCKDLHGHTFRVRVEVKTEKINEVGISFDFKALKAITESVIEPFDHHHINDIAPFDQQNPTAENLSHYIYHEVKKKLPSSVHISRVTVWESATYSVSYSET